MLKITFTLLIVYSLPLFFILISISATDFFAYEDNSVAVADAITGGFFNLFRDTFGTIIVPLVTAYTIPERKSDSPLSKEFYSLFYFLVSLFVLAVVLYAIIKYQEPNLIHFNVEDDTGKITKDIPKIFYDTLVAYGKEMLAYIALILGISLKKGG